ncbi:MAG: nickel-dependent lactate racemase [Pyrinomonadaceae bacterium]
MPEIELKYGNTSVPFTFVERRFGILAQNHDPIALSDAQIGDKLDNPIDSRTIEEIVKPGQTVLIVVPDATRQTACGQIVNILVRRLIANGTTPFEISIIFATGIHRPVTEAEKISILTPFIAQRIKTLNHGSRDITQIVRLGEIAGGIPVELNRALTEHEHVILVGGVTFHYFAGFTGGRKLVCPGLASSKTISQTHKLAFDCNKTSRRDGVDTGLLDGNAVHEAFMDAVAKVNPAFCISTIVDDSGDAVDLFCGDWISSHRAACDAYAARNTIEISEKRPIVIASCGGYPHDINLIQAHKALETASHACADGGTIILLAECSEGMGRPNFLNWFEAGSSDELAKKLCESYQVNGQTAWSLLKKTERFQVKLITSISAGDTEKLRIKKASSLNDALLQCDSAGNGYLMPFGAKNMVRVGPPTSSSN